MRDAGRGGQPPGRAAGFAGNVLLGGAVGMVTDSVTYAAYDHTPNPLKVILTPLRRRQRQRRLGGVGNLPLTTFTMLRERPR